MGFYELYNNNYYYYIDSYYNRDSVRSKSDIDLKHLNKYLRARDNHLILLTTIFKHLFIVYFISISVRDILFVF